MSAEIIDQLRIANVSLNETAIAVSTMSGRMEALADYQRSNHKEWMAVVGQMAQTQVRTQKFAAVVVISSVSVVSVVVSVLMNIIM